MKYAFISNLWRMVCRFLLGCWGVVAVVAGAIFTDEYGIRFIWFIVLLWGGVVGVIVGVATVIDSHQCSTYAEMSRITTEYRFFTCYVDYKGRFIPIEEYRARAITNE